MRVRLNEPELAHELAAALRDAGCNDIAVGDHGLTVGHPSASDAHEETIELTFFMRAWQARHSAGGLELEY